MVFADHFKNATVFDIITTRKSADHKKLTDFLIHIQGSHQAVYKDLFACFELAIKRAKKKRTHKKYSKRPSQQSHIGLMRKRKHKYIYFPCPSLGSKERAMARYRAAFVSSPL